jgi:hypothetical protein
MVAAENAARWRRAEAKHEETASVFSGGTGIRILVSTT